MNAEAHLKVIEETYLESECETAQVDFKAGFDPSSNQEWCELLKDVVAMANSGGGCIIIGKNDNGEPSGLDIEAVLAIDPADLSNKVEKYTGCQYADFRIIERKSGAGRVACFIFGGVDIPMIFTKPGTYGISGTNQQKTAFSQGAVYFRHGAKSEPGTADDLRLFLERELARVRKGWLENVRKVIEAPAGSHVTVIASEANIDATVAGVLRLTTNLDAPLIRELNPNQTHPHRQKHVISLVGEKLGLSATITSHDIVAVRNVHGIEMRPEFCYRPKYSSSQFSDEFVTWIIREYQKNPQFFAEAKRRYHKESGTNGTPADDVRLLRLDSHMRKKGLSKSAVAKKIGISGSTISLLLRGIYEGDTERMIQRIEKWLMAEGADAS